MAEENQEVAVQAAQEGTDELDAQGAQEEYGDPPVEADPDAIEEEDESLNPPDQFKEDKEAKQQRDKRGDE